MRKEPATPEKIVKALRQVAAYFDGERGIWAYEVFDAINGEYFDGQLPTPNIRWSLTPHGGCLALTRARNRPIVNLHPSLLGGTESPNPWGISPAWLGVCYAFDVLLHESIHISQHCLHGGGTGTTSHNNTAWIAEVNRIAPLLGLHGPTAGLSKLKRVPIPGEFTSTGKPKTKVARVSEGNVPHCAVAGFPLGFRTVLGSADSFYRAKVLPVTCSIVLQGRNHGCCP
jgi:hypothetical protein